MFTGPFKYKFLCSSSSNTLSKIIHNKLNKKCLSSLEKFFSAQTVWCPPIGPSIGLRIFNSTIEDKVSFTIPNDSYVSWFSSGPHPLNSNYEHLSVFHAYNYVKQDILQRIFREHFNINLVTAMNINGMDKNIAYRSVHTDRSWREVTHENEQLFMQQMNQLNVMQPNLKMFGSEFGDEIIRSIKSLVERRKAYIAPNGAVYFNLIKYMNTCKAEENSDRDIYFHIPQKEHVKNLLNNFPIWLPKMSPGEPSFTAPWGEGRPTYEMECNALASYIFGKSIDIHTGDVTSKYPHHYFEDMLGCANNETKQWVNYWLHFGNSNDSSPTKNNTSFTNNKVTIREMLNNYKSDVFRIACLLTNYQQDFIYSKQLMEKSSQILDVLENFNNCCWCYLNNVINPTNINRMVLFKNFEYTFKEVNSSLTELDTVNIMTLLSDQMTSTIRAIEYEQNIDKDCVDSPCFDLISCCYNYVNKMFGMFGVDYIKRLQKEASFEKTLADGVARQINMLDNESEALKREINKFDHNIPLQITGISNNIADDEQTDSEMENGGINVNEETRKQQSQ